MSTNIAELPCMKLLDVVAKKLPPEFRRDLYETAEKFYVIGMGQGVMAAMLNGIPKKNIPNELDENKKFLLHFQNRKTENTVKGG